jgi:hypothetical protein
MTIYDVLEILLVLVSAGLLIGFSLYLRNKRRKPGLREIEAFRKLNQAIGLTVEDGTRLHVALGRSSLLTQRSAAAFAGLGALRHLAEVTATSDQPPIATSGNAALSILSQDTLHSAYKAAGSEEQYDPLSGRLPGLTPFSYVAGTLPIMRDENVSANLLMGNFGAEIGLLTDAAERNNSFCLAATDDIAGQSVIFGTAQEILIGEELYAAGAYVHASPTHIASLHVQDILRWLTIGLLLGGTVLKIIGVL